MQLHVTDRDAFRPVRTGLAVLAALRELSGTRFAWRTEEYEFVTDRPAIDLLFGSDRERLALEAGSAVARDRGGVGAGGGRVPRAPAAVPDLPVNERSAVIAEQFDRPIAWIAMQLAPLDLAIVVVYVLGMTLLGRLVHPRQKDLRTYFVGDRNVGWWLVLISIVATETSTVTFLSVPGLGFNPNGGNLTFLQLAFGYIIGRCLVAWLLLPQYMSGELFTRLPGAAAAVQPGGAAGRRRAVPRHAHRRRRAAALPDRPAAAVRSPAGTSVPAIVVVGVVTIVYTYLGGMKAVIWTDLIQFVIKIAGAVLARRASSCRCCPAGGTSSSRTATAAGKFKLHRPDVRPDDRVQRSGPA